MAAKFLEIQVLNTPSIYQEDSGLLSRPYRKEGPQLAMTGASCGFSRVGALLDESKFSVM